MPDLDSMIKALKASLAKTNFQCKERNLEVLPWISFERLRRSRHTIKLQLQHYWSGFRKTFSVELEWRCIIWNNQEIRINNKTVFYKTYPTSGINYVSDLHFNLSHIESFNMIANTIDKTNYFIWTGLRHSVPFVLRQTNCHPSIKDPSFNSSNELFDVTKRNLRTTIQC